MAVGISEEHRELRGSVRRLLEREVSGPVVRAALAEGPGAVGTARPLWWKALAEQGLLGPHLPEEHGGGGGALLDLAVVVEEAGRGLLPGGYLPTVLAAALLARADATAPRLADLADGGLTAAVAWHATVTATPAGRLDGVADVVVGAAEADLLVVRAVAASGPAWYAVPANAARIVPLAALDLARGLARVAFTDVAAEPLDGLADVEAMAVVRTVLAAEASGLARWALETAVTHAKVREQFGRPIGQFQAVKHLCATLLVRAEKAAAATWAAARETVPLTASVAAALAVDAACANAEDCIQILGGIGFTWEHDAHLRLRRALTLRQLLGGDGALWREVATAAAPAGEWRPHLQLPSEAEEFRAEARAAAASVAGLEPAEQRRRLAPQGWAAPHLPPPYGLGAGPLRQLVVEQELRAAGVHLPDLTIGNWVVPSLAAHGTDAQRERLLAPTLRGELTWCQLFSEPEAGSDLAALRTRAVRQDDGSWRVDGQKVWTSSARTADYGILLARTAPDKPKHKGLTYFVVDMRATPGITIRPLRELTGDAVFNEVFLDDVRLPADAVVGSVDEGWRVARHTLGNERVHMADSSPTGPAVQRLLRAPGADPVTLGRLVADEHVLTCIDLRTTLSALDGLDPGAGGSVRKLVSAPHAQRVAAYALELCGEAGAVHEGLGREVGHALLMSRCLTIAGGTTQVQLNVVAERILGLPRDPQPASEKTA
ncbi:acyl-CoA dehydrogenase [Streptacidiphilus jiangxiensis]|uniref:Acyl-CoA dehydrogenase n=1 Tax=Streptacidiphilus jiangxiensis TaxID=235985 RepID=A0A1H7VWQ3_STRJI|nr:acyl-CoA dehydrogenase [Streptacidiphilus jiangxiensis]SEM13703.1 Acyl-CoA dehydrogenase [Streptacidiphilus jiangxiensis]